MKPDLPASQREEVVKKYSSHSLKRGAITDSFKQGCTDHELRALFRFKRTHTVNRYSDTLTVATPNAQSFDSVQLFNVLSFCVSICFSSLFVPVFKNNYNFQSPPPPNSGTLNTLCWNFPCPKFIALNSIEKTVATKQASSKVPELNASIKLLLLRRIICWEM